MNEKKKFPDYEPKKTTDTLYDYLKEPSIVFEVLSKLPKAEVINLKSFLDLFKKYKTEAKNNPGGTRPGNVAIGADSDQYYPSEEEIIVSEMGKLINEILKNTSKDDLVKVLKEENIDTKTIEYQEIYYRHVDVMGSGRFFYAEKRADKTYIHFQEDIS
jgi:hypothetical protein